MEEGKKEGMARLWQLASRKKILIFFSVFFAIISAICNYVPFISVYNIVKEVILTLPTLDGLNTDYIINQGLIAAAAFVLAVVANVIALSFSHIAAFITIYDLKVEYIKHLSKLSLGFHTDNPTGKLRKVVDDNIERLEGFIAHDIPDLVQAVSSPILLVIIMFYFDWRFGIALIVPIILSFVLQNVLYKSAGGAKQMMKNYISSLEEMNANAVEYVRGISVLKAFNQTIFSFKRFHDSIESYSKYVLKWTYKMKWPMTAFVCIVNNAYLFLIPCAVLVFNFSDDYAAFVLSFIFYLILAPSTSTVLMKILYSGRRGQEIAADIYKMDNYLSTKPLEDNMKHLVPNNNKLSFENVCFSYNDDETNALKGVSFDIDENEVTAIVGPSGSGKSTIAHLIPRFYDVNSGSIKIGGINIKDMSYEELMTHVSFVFQDVFLFKQSVFDNIKMGNPNATREDVINAAKMAQCHSFIEELPNGYDTVIETKGIHLSGGERQRIVIARAIVKDAPIIVLDEATAFADPENENLIQKAFESLLKNKTVIVIAHRLSTIKNANKIIVMNEGEVIEVGNHDKLIKLNGLYKQMYDTYQSSLSWHLRKEDNYA